MGITKLKIFKCHKDAVIPKYGREGDAGLDLTAVSKKVDKYGNMVYGFGLKMEIQPGYVGLLFPRSSLANYNMSMSNCVGVIDSNFRGEVAAKFKPVVNHYDYKEAMEFNSHYEVGDRCAQLVIVPVPHVEIEEVSSEEMLSETVRGENGYGSSGK